MARTTNMSDYSDDDRLLYNIRHEDVTAFSAIYDKYHRMLYGLGLRYLKDTSMAEDVVQHVFMKLWEYRHDIEVKASLKNYLYTMARNHILNLIRNKNAAVVHNYKIASASGGLEDDLGAFIEKSDLLGKLYTIIDRLPEQKRIVCRLKMEDKLSNQEIADKMQISINTVKSHYAEAVKILRNHLGVVVIFIMPTILF